MDKGLFFYKLISPYIEDITKNCKLTINEIDSNFLTLKNGEIKEIKLSEDEESIVLVRKDGEEFSTALPSFIKDIIVEWDKNSGDLSIKFDNNEFTADGILTDENLEFDWDKGNGNLTINYGDKQYVADGILTDESGLISEVNHDSTLHGKGTIAEPIGIALTDTTGMYSPVKSIINMIDGEELPENPTIGDRYLSSELLSDYGYLYNYEGVSEVIRDLAIEGSEWRVPSKSDWDKLLNSIEPCDYQNHNDDVCHVFLGKYAGIKLKSKDKWRECVQVPYVDEEGLEHASLSPAGIDTFGFRVLPSGYGNEESETNFFGEKTGFWTTSHIKTPGHETETGDIDQDIYVKLFDYRKTGVLQEAECPEKYYSLRLVKDYNGFNFKDVEVINGKPYPAILFEDIQQIWIASNLSYPVSRGKILPNNGEELDVKKIYFLNVYNGTIWDKKKLSHGDSIVVNNGPKYENEEFRVFIDSEGNQMILAVDDVVYERVMRMVGHLIDEEAATREENDNHLSEAIQSEAATREEIDNQQWQAIQSEAATREDVDNQQWQAIQSEAATREENDNHLSEAIQSEAATREDVDNQQWGQIIDNPNDPSGKKNVETPDEYVLKVNGVDDANLVLYSKGGTNNIEIFFDGNYGEL